MDNNPLPEELSQHLINGINIALGLLEPGQYGEMVLRLKVQDGKINFVVVEPRFSYRTDKKGGSKPRR